MHGGSKQPVLFRAQPERGGQRSQRVRVRVLPLAQLDSEANLWDRGRDVAFAGGRPSPRPQRRRLCGGGLYLESPAEPPGGLSAAQRRVQLQTITPAILAGRANCGHTVEARRLPKPRVGSSSLSRATSEFNLLSASWTSGPFLIATALYTRSLRFGAHPFGALESHTLRLPWRPCSAAQRTMCEPGTVAMLSRSDSWRTWRSEPDPWMIATGRANSARQPSS